jgi:hypothetical protein
MKTHRKTSTLKRASGRKGWVRAPIDREPKPTPAPPEPKPPGQIVDVVNVRIIGLPTGIKDLIVQG